MVNLEWYRTFKSVYKNRNFSLAAKELFISQPAVSQQISMLEAHVGYKLFNRKSKGVEPTEYAKLLNNLIIEALDRLENVENGFRYFLKALYECGVTVIVASYLSKTSIFGGTFVVNKKPCIVLTNYFKRYDRLWFTLAHELKHVLFDLEIIEKQGYHLTGQDDLFQDDYIEEQANKFARDLLLPRDQYNSVKNLIDVPEIVHSYGQQVNVHPSIIYGFYLYDNKNEHNFYKKFIPNTKKTLNNIEVNPWKTKTILEAIEISKRNLAN